MSDTMIKGENLTKIYKLYHRPIERLKEVLSPMRKKYHQEFYALKNVSFEIKKGETVGIIGKNGAGKSTLLKMIAGVLTPTQGSIQVNGKIASLLELGAGFNPEYTGLENIYLQGTMFGYSRQEIEKKIPDILEFSDIGEFINQPFKTYSSGMAARLAFSTAINVEPEILIVDEALSVGDAAFQLKCFNRFKLLQESGVTILFVSHSLESIIRFCSSCIVFHLGEKIVQARCKEAVDIFKKILVNSYEESEEVSLVKTLKKESLKIEKEKKLSSYFNRQLLSMYGNKKAEIVDFGIVVNGNPCISITQNHDFSIVMDIQFHMDIENPIFAYAIKDVKGLEYVGDNSYHQKMFGKYHQGERIRVYFEQKANFQSGEYFLSLGCVRYQADGEVEVFQRVYDCLSFNVVNLTSFTGLYSLNSSINIEKIG